MIVLGWQKDDRVDVFGDRGTVVGPATPLYGSPRWLVRWDKDDAITEVMQSNLRPEADT